MTARGHEARVLRRQADPLPQLALRTGADRVSLAAAAQQCHVAVHSQPPVRELPPVAIHTARFQYRPDQVRVDQYRVRIGDADRRGRRGRAAQLRRGVLHEMSLAVGDRSAQVSRPGRHADRSERKDSTASIRSCSTQRVESRSHAQRQCPQSEPAVRIPARPRGPRQGPARRHRHDTARRRQAVEPADRSVELAETRQGTEQVQHEGGEQHPDRQVDYHRVEASQKKRVIGHIV